MNKTQIFIIYAHNCSKCERLTLAVEEAIRESKCQCEIFKYYFETEVALSICANRGIDEVPGLVIGDYVTKGDNFTKNSILKAINNASNKKH